MLLLIVLLVLGLILWMERSFWSRETLVSETVPLSFPNGTQTIKMPPIVEPQNGPLQVKGPVKLGMVNDNYMNFSTDGTTSKIEFYRNGQSNNSIVSTGGSGRNDGVLDFNSSKVTINSPLVTGPLNAPNLQVEQSLRVNRPDTEPYVANWGSGIHTLNLYANQYVGVGPKGMVAAGMNSDGAVFGNTAFLKHIQTTSIWIGTRDLVAEINALNEKLSKLSVDIDN
jgi:hypothetical protein